MVSLDAGVDGRIGMVNEDASGFSSSSKSLARMERWHCDLQSSILAQLIFAASEPADVMIWARVRGWIGVRVHKFRTCC